MLYARRITMTGPLRSILFVPATRPDRFAKAEGAGADAVVFDLEDSVAVDRKEQARQAVASWLASAAPAPLARIVRINAASTPAFRDDLDWLATITAPDAIMLPKAHDSWAIDHVASASPKTAVIPLIETARGVLNAFAMTAAKAAMPALAFGADDLTAEVGVPRTVDGEELLLARSQVVLAATAIGAEAIDGIIADIGNDDLLRRDARRARALGFRGKLAIHPSQVPIINEVFSPTTEEVARARRIIEAYDAALARGDGVLQLDGRMVDTPMVVRAQKVVALARRIEERI